MKTLLRGGQIVDGSGAPARMGDVLLDGERIVSVGSADEADRRAATIVDCDGLVIAPGFIDVHTHYDAQVFWDPDLTPSSWHGVTTVVMGNCGFGIAPTRPKDRGTIARILENVEGMTLEALEAGIPWGFESFPEYLAAVSSLPLRINVAAYVGHTPVRQYVMGDAATERAATAEEVEAMRRIVGEAMDAGAIGFSTSHAASHVGAYGKPIPSRLAELSEIWTLAGELGRRGVGVVEATWGPDLFVDEFASLAKEIDRPVSWAAIMATRRSPEYAPDVVCRTKAAGGFVRPQIAGRAIVVQIMLTDPGPFGNVPSFVEVLALPHAERPKRYRNAEWRQRAEREITQSWGDIVDRARVSESERHKALVSGSTLGELAMARGTTAFALMIDLALEEDLATRFHVPMTNDNEDQIGQMLNDDQLLLGLSDAGAHTSQLCDADFATYLLQHWWRETKTISLERIFDLPAGADRLVARSKGIEHVFVAGQASRKNGRELAAGAGAGRVVRPG